MLAPVDCRLDACPQLLCCLVVVAVGVDHDGVSVTVDDLAAAAGSKQAGRLAGGTIQHTETTRTCCGCLSNVSCASVGWLLCMLGCTMTATALQQALPTPSVYHRYARIMLCSSSHCSPNTAPWMSPGSPHSQGTPSPPAPAAPAPAPGPRWTGGCHGPGS